MLFTETLLTPHPFITKPINTFVSHFLGGWDDTEEAASYHLGLEPDLHSSTVSKYFGLILPLSTSVYLSAMAFTLINP